jgi:hypothetical protein
MKPCELPAALEKLPFVASAKWYPADNRDLSGYALNSSARTNFAEYCGYVVATTAEGYTVRREYAPWHAAASAQQVRADGLRIAASLAESMAEVALGLRVSAPKMG